MAEHFANKCAIDSRISVEQYYDDVKYTQYRSLVWYSAYTDTFSTYVIFTVTSPWKEQVKIQVDCKYDANTGVLDSYDWALTDLEKQE